MNSHDVQGVLAIDKPGGMTSHDVVAEARRLLGVQRIGHTGTLDPMATGLLLLCIGTATKAARWISGHGKEYVADILLGVDTDSGDALGRVTRKVDASAVSKDEVLACLNRQRGNIEQDVPDYSAVRRGGRRHYERARSGQPVPTVTRLVNIDVLDLLHFENPLVRIRIRCSSGTYIRAIAMRLGQELGCGAHLTGLRRTSIDQAQVENACSLGDLRIATLAERWDALQPLRDFLPGRHLQVTPEFARRVHFGGVLKRTDTANDFGDVSTVGAGTLIVLLDQSGVTIAIGEAVDSWSLQDPPEGTVLPFRYHRVLASMTLRAGSSVHGYNGSDLTEAIPNYRGTEKPIQFAG